MDIAYVKYGQGNPVLMSAKEVQERFNGAPPRGVKFTCPCCEQPLHARAMRRYSERAAHFSHEANNKEAQYCEYYVQGMNGDHQMYRASMPMFIRRSAKDPNYFYVEAGFKQPDPKLVSLLEESGATLCIGKAKYLINSERFGTGITKLCFDQMSLHPSEFISLSKSPYPLRTIWEPPEDAHRAMVFTRDMVTDQGKRLRRGETVRLGSMLYILTDKDELKTLTDAFPGATLIGITHTFYGGSSLQVSIVTMPNDCDINPRAIDYIQSCGLRIGGSEDVLKTIWPPSILSSGIVEPLYKFRSPIVSMSIKREIDNVAYVFNNIATLDNPHIVGSSATLQKDWRTITANLSNSAGIVSRKRDSLEDSLFISECPQELLESMREDSGVFATANIYEDQLELLLRSPCRIELLSRRAGRVTSRVEGGDPIQLQLSGDELVRVYWKLLAHHGRIIEYEHVPEVPTAAFVEPQHQIANPKADILKRHLPDGRKRADWRNGFDHVQSHIHHGKLLASIRRSQ